MSKCAETRKRPENGEMPKSKKKLSNLVLSRPEKGNLTLKTAMKIEFHFKGKKKQSFFADNKLQYQFGRKLVAKSKKLFFI